jgi:serine/threonine protein kinase
MEKKSKSSEVRSESKKSSKNFNLIPERIETIKSMVGKSNIESIIDFKNSTESFEYPTNTEDIRGLLPKKYIEFGKAISELGGRLLYIKSGSTGHTFKGIHPPPNEENKESYAVKIVAYPKKENYGDMYNIKRPENTELLMIRLLSYFVINKQTPHIVLPITTFNTSIKPFLNLTKSNIVNNKKFEQFVERYQKGEYYQNVSILISEWANGGDLLEHIRKNYKTMKTKHWRTIFFQILSVLSVIHAKYPSFRHNDMKANNILIHHIDVDNQDRKYLYKINNQNYIVPNIGFQIKLWDFDFACIPNIVDNSKVEAEWTTKINVTPVQNKYYDIHYFLNTLTRKGFFPEFWTADEVPDRVKDFVKRVVPAKYENGDLVSDRGRILVNDEYLTPDEILKNDPFFKLMRK